MRVARGGGRGGLDPPQLEPSANFGVKIGALRGYYSPKNPKIFLRLAAQPKTCTKISFFGRFSPKNVDFWSILAKFRPKCAHYRRIFGNFSNVLI